MNQKLKTALDTQCGLVRMYSWNPLFLYTYLLIYNKLLCIRIGNDNVIIVLLNFCLKRMLNMLTFSYWRI